jgi:hypothetical protein
MSALAPPRYRSTTEYCFREEQVDAIIRTTAYHRRDYGLSVIWFHPREHASIRTSIATPFEQTLDVGIGVFDRLPLELLYHTFLCLDMNSLFKFRQTNRMARHMVDSLNEYQLVAAHGLDLFCALLRTQLARIISLSDFYKSLCTENCDICGQFGGFVSFLTWTRCCFKCLQEAPETQVQSLAAARKQFHLTKAKLTQMQLVSFKTLPGIYTMEESVFKRRITIVSAHQVALASHGPYHEPMQVRRASTQIETKYNFMGSCALPYYDRGTGNIEDGISCGGCQLAIEKDIVVGRWAFDARDKEYARNGFVEHFRWCEQAQLLWISSDEGRRRPPELPEVVRRRGFFMRRE